MPKKMPISASRTPNTTSAFLDALNAGGGKPMEQMKPKEAQGVGGRATQRRGAAARGRSARKPFT
ncbi:hypothetical protein M8494_07305 [Serratia ureilytica]